ncbi:unnamed protein product [Amoebophrya sp. A120]|nr:unnamed protein product [Amoebophrya sp. A120]|eukprot:GSA120T00000379001.1
MRPRSSTAGAGGAMMLNRYNHNSSGSTSSGQRTSAHQAPTKPLSSLDAVSNLEMHFVHHDLWQEGQFLTLIEQIEALSNKFVRVCDVHSRNLSRADMLATMRTPYALEQCRINRDQEFQEIAAVATAELKGLSQDIAEAESSVPVLAIDKQARGMLKQMQTNVLQEEQDRIAMLESALTKMETRFKEVRTSLADAAQVRRTSHDRLLGLIENCESSLGSHLENERYARQAAAERMLNLFENLLGCVELRQEQEALAPLIRPTSDGGLSPRTMRLLAQYGRDAGGIKSAQAAARGLATGGITTAGRAAGGPSTSAAQMMQRPAGRASPAPSSSPNGLPFSGKEEPPTSYSLFGPPSGPPRTAPHQGISSSSASSSTAWPGAIDAGNPSSVAAADEKEDLFLFQRGNVDEARPGPSTSSSSRPGMVVTGQPANDNDEDIILEDILVDEPPATAPAGSAPSSLPRAWAGLDSLASEQDNLPPVQAFTRPAEQRGAVDPSLADMYASIKSRLHMEQNQNQNDFLDQRDGFGEL